MRDIKFRVWDGINMYYLDDNSKIVLEFNKISGWNLRTNKIGMNEKYITGESTSNTFEIMKYIATNGKQDFYVGDIVVNPKGREHTVVIWDNIPCLKYTNKGKVYFSPMTNGFLDNKTVIGNTHENKDLI